MQRRVLAGPSPSSRADVRARAGAGGRRAGSAEAVACAAACGGAQRGSREVAWGGAQREQEGHGDAVLESVERAATKEAVEASPSG